MTSSLIAEVGFTEVWWIQILKCLVIVIVVLQIGSSAMLTAQCFAAVPFYAGLT